MKTNPILAAALILSTSLTSFAGQGDNCDWPKIQPLKNGNLVSTYTFDFWNFARKNMDDYFKDNNLFEQGPVVGDFHFNNVGAYFNTQTKKVELAIVDLDDSGEASYLADYLKYVSYLTTITKSVDSKSLIKNYVKGLSAKSYTDTNVPSHMDEILHKKEEWFNAKNNAGVLKKTNSSQNRFGKNEDLKDITTLSSDIKGLVEKLNSDMKVLDSGYKINESGSSMGSLRVLVLGVENKALNLYEFKELRCPGVEKFKSQDNQSSRFATMKKAFKSEDFWGRSYIATARDLKSNDETSFIFRKKQENAVQDLAIDHLKDKDMAEYQDYFAFLLGYFHGLNASNAYKKAVQGSEKQVAKGSEQFAKDYLDHLDEKISGKEKGKKN